MIGSRRTHVGIMLATLVMAGCGGGGGSSTGSPLPVVQKTPANTVFVITIPRAPAASADRRIPHYVTANVKAIDFAVTQGGASGPVGVGYTFSVLSPQAAYCQSTSGALKCSVAVNAPPGTDTFAVNLYDEASSATADIIATGSLTQTITANTSNTISITTEGVPAIAILGSTNLYPAVGTVATIPIATQITDADGDVIIGSYSTPVTVTNSDASGATVLSKTVIASNSDLAGLSVSYNGAALPSGATIQFNDASSALANRALGSVLGSTTIVPGANRPNISPAYLYFASKTAAAQSITVTGGSPPYTVTLASCTGNVSVSGSSPAFTITPTAPTIDLTSNPTQSYGNCYVGVTDAASQATYFQVIVGN